jgi:hypothetical protein
MVFTIFCLSSFLPSQDGYNPVFSQLDILEQSSKMVSPGESVLFLMDSAFKDLERLHSKEKWSLFPNSFDHGPQFYVTPVNIL